MSNSSKFVKLVKQISQQPESSIVNIVTGKVISISPLIIKADEVELTERFLVVGALCKETRINIPLRNENKHSHTIDSHQTGSTSVGDHGGHTHSIGELITSESLPEILLWRGLEVGDNVWLLKISNSQQYYVLQRGEGIN
jgi:hypothetical protein